MNDSKYFLVRIPLWIKEYGSSGNPDQRNMTDFMICESPEAVRSLQAELMLLSQGKVPEESLEKIIGKKRKILFGGYDQWAKMMLLWISSYKG